MRRLTVRVPIRLCANNRWFQNRLHIGIASMAGAPFAGFETTIKEGTGNEGRKALHPPNSRRSQPRGAARSVASSAARRSMSAAVRSFTGVDDCAVIGP